MEKINIIAFCLPLVIFAFWEILGYATLSLLRTQRNTLQNMLMAPAIGIAVTLLFVFSFNRIGIPIGHFALPLTLILLVGSIGVLAWKKPIFAGRCYLPFFLIFLLTLFLVGRPLLEFGFDWVSYSNDDMANYSLGAMRFLHDGYYQVPDFTLLLKHKDYTLNYWFMHALENHRGGSELIIAWASGTFKVATIKMFMPIIMALHLSLISVASALIATSRRYRCAALVLCLLLAFSALMALGTLYQLIAQVGGCALLAAGAILLLQPFTLHKKGIFLHQSILIGIIFSALTIYYPEITPFLGLSFVLYLVVSVLQGWRPNKQFYVSLSGAIALALLFLNTYTIGAIHFFLRQLHGGAHAMSASELKGALFPYYLMPSGMANLWGMQAIAIYPTEPWMSISIAIGTILFIVSIVAIVWSIWRRLSAAGCIAFIMLCTGFVLFTKHADFGLFKLAMYIQPFLLGALTIAIFSWIKSPRGKTLFFAFIIICGIYGQSYYLNRSRALTAGGLTEIVYGSNTKINQEFANLIAPIPVDDKIVSADFNLCVLKFQSYMARGREFDMLTFPVYYNIKTDFLSPFMKLTQSGEKLYRTYLKEFHELTTQFFPLQFDLHDPKDPNKKDSFFGVTTLQHINPDKTWLVQDTVNRGIMNKRYVMSEGTRNFIVQPWNEVKNRLIYISSTRGPIYYAVGNDKKILISLNNVENDTAYPHELMQAVRRYLLFRIVNPSHRFRVEFNLTTSFQADGINQLPKTDVIGKKRIHLPFIGNGSARVFSPPITPQIIRGIPYIEIDMNSEGKQFPDGKTGLMRLYGHNIPKNFRNIVGFARDVSIVSEKEYDQLKAPSFLSHFPLDLKNPNLEYSGIYESGLIGQHSYFMLSQPDPKARLVITGNIPVFHHHPVSPTLIVTVDGRKVGEEKNLAPGHFALRIDIPYRSTRRKIELYFDKSQKCPAGDNRPISAQMTTLGFSDNE